jgi:hypothetical protein
VSAFGNSVSMPIVVLGLSGHCNGYWATIAVICNIRVVIVVSVTKVAVLWFQGETGNEGRYRTNTRVDRSLCRTDARAAFVGIQQAHLVIR